MPIKETLEADIVAAQKAKDEAALSTLRQLKNAVDQAEIANGRQALPEDGLVKLLRGEAKKRKDAIADYEQGGRAELAAKEAAEIEVIERYLPAEMPDEQLAEIVKAAVAESGASGPADLGKVMPLVMGKVAGQADGSRVRALVAEALQG